MMGVRSGRKLGLKMNVILGHMSLPFYLPLSVHFPPPQNRMHATTHLSSHRLGGKLLPLFVLSADRLTPSQNKPVNAWYHSPLIHTARTLLHPQDVFCIIGLYQLLCQIWTHTAQTPDQANSDCRSMHRTVPGSLGFSGDMNYKQLMHIKLTMCMLGHTHGRGGKAREI